MDRGLQYGRWSALVALCLCVSLGCADDPGPVENDDRSDIGVEEDAGIDAPVSEDVADEDAGADVADTGDPDADVEGEPDAEDGPVDGPDDNCPEISNPDQADRSRDGIGDACDNFPFFHAPSNPTTVEIIYESDRGPNDGWWDAMSNWTLDLPFVLEGTIAEPGEEDWYLIDVDEPTTLLFHLEALDSSSIWPGVFVIGDDFQRNRHVESVILGANEGESEVRDLHLPVAGSYLVVVVDVRSVLEGSGPSGSSDHDYRLWVSTPPLPESEPVSLPTPRRILPYDRGEGHVFSVDVAGEDALYVEATGAPRNQNSVLVSSVQFLDPDTGEVLAYTNQSQADDESLRNELTMKVGDMERVEVLVEAHQSLGDNDIVVDIEGVELPEYEKSYEEPVDTREDRMPWVRPGAEIGSMIGPPYAVADNALEADEDFYLYYGRPGDFIEVSVEPTGEQLLQPELQLAALRSSGFLSRWHDSGGAISAGESASLSMFLTDENFYDAAIHVAHGPNSGTSLPVGGPKYAYDLSVDALDVDDHKQSIEGMPASTTVELQPGEQGLYEFDLQPGWEYRLDFDGQFRRQMRLVDVDTGQLVAMDRDQLEFLGRPDRTLMVAVRDERGVAIPETEDVELEITDLSAPESVAYPGVFDGDLGGQTEREVYAFDVTAGELIEAQAMSEQGPAPQVELIGSETSATSDDGTLAVARAEEDSTMLAVVSRSTDVAVEYSLRLGGVELEEADTPLEVVGSFDEQLAAKWWELSAEEIDELMVNAAGASNEEEPLWYGLFDAETLKPVADGLDFGMADVSGVDELYLAVSTIGGPVEPLVDYGVSVSEVEIQEYGEGDTAEFAQGLRPALYSFGTDEGGLSRMEVLPEGDRSVATRITTETYGVLSGDETWPLAAVARSEARSFVGMAIPDDLGGDSFSGDIEVELVGIDEAVELDDGVADEETPLQVDDWPGVYRGRLGGELSPRVFSADLEEGDGLWVIAIPAADVDAVFDPSLGLWGPEGQQLSSTDDSEGNFPALKGVEIDSNGEWFAELEVDADEEREFVVYFLRR